MPTSQARVATTVPRRYLGQLCKHFQHKLPVTLTDDTGCIEFPAGVCTVGVDADALLLQVDAADADGIARLEDVVARHLVRFAWREPPEITWTRSEGVRNAGTHGAA